MASSHRARVYATLVVALSAGACVPSLQPLFTERDLVFDDQLIGTWAAGDESWTFDKLDALSYRLIIREKGVDAEFVAHLGQLGGHRFLDIYPDETAMQSIANGAYGLSFIPAHGFFKVGEIGPRLGLQVLDHHWFGNYLRLHPRALGHYDVPDHGLVLTASTCDLQKFLLRNSAAFSESEFLTRQAKEVGEGQPSS
jgi:hypothetical protein